MKLVWLENTSPWDDPRLMLRLGMTLAVVGAAAALLALAVVRPPPEYYKFVDEVMANLDAWRGRRLRVHGFVSCDSLQRQPGTMNYRFQLDGPPGRPRAVMRARYTGLLPETFRPGDEVVVAGMLADDGVIDVLPDGIMSKCPSKYELVWPPRDRCAATAYVDQVVAEPPEAERATPSWVVGVLESDSPQRQAGTDLYRFRIASPPERPPAVIDARYAGRMPERFRRGGEVAVLGTLAADGTLEVIENGILVRP